MTQSWRPFLQTGRKPFQIKSFPLRNEVKGVLSAASYLLPPVVAKWLSRRQCFPSSASVLLPTPGKVEGAPQIPVQSGRG